jgi:hypothetical protein
VDIEPLRVVAFSPRHECGVEGGGWLRYGSSRNPLSQAALLRLCADNERGRILGCDNVVEWSIDLPR